MTLRDHLLNRIDGLHARWDALTHLFRGHDVVWRDSVDLWLGITGNIVCRNCPDSNGDGVAFWTRYWNPLRLVAEFICGILGHPGVTPWTEWNGEYDDNGEMIHVPTGTYCCSRCAADVDAPNDTPTSPAEATAS